ncbi:MAG: low-specificity L-threonine aldolase [Anaerolineales bacterium]|nr:low-specificity L-threonine aldolase [Anaerolineales bacterium]
MSFENGLIDLRSDTVTHPTPAMRQAMATADVGDDVFNDDPTVHQLEALAAALTGHTAAMFVASGTMGNLIALLTHGARGQEVIVGSQSHIYLNEGGGMAALAGLQAYPLPNQPDGTLRLEDIEAAIRTEDVHHPRTRLVCLENTQNICGGVPLSVTYTRRVADLAHSRGLQVHLDGARLFNAAVAQGVSAADLAEPADTVMFCLSKGLSAPVGSLLCGSKDFIAEARRNRKLVGGGLRQAGVLAAAGLIALDSMIERLEDDHANARALAAGLRSVPGLALRTPNPATNMVYFDLTPPARLQSDQLVDHLRRRGIVLDGDGGSHFRLVTHYWVSAADIEKTVAAFRDVLGPA